MSTTQNAASGSALDHVGGYDVAAADLQSRIGAVMATRGTNWGRGEGGNYGATAAAGRNGDLAGACGNRGGFSNCA